VPQDNVDAVRVAYEAINRGDMGPYLALFHEDGVFQEPASLPYGGTYRGHDGLQQLFDTLDASWESLEFDVQKFLDAGEHVVILTRVRALARSTGKQCEVPLVEVLTMRDGKIVRSEAHSDTARLLDALGIDATAAA